jgi:hypothetical protein
MSIFRSYLNCCQSKFYHYSFAGSSVPSDQELWHSAEEDIDVVSVDSQQGSNQGYSNTANYVFPITSPTDYTLPSYSSHQLFAEPQNSESQTCTCSASSTNLIVPNGCDVTQEFKFAPTEAWAGTTGQGHDEGERQHSTHCRKNKQVGNRRNQTEPVVKKSSVSVLDSDWSMRPTTSEVTAPPNRGPVSILINDSDSELDIDLDAQAEGMHHRPTPPGGDKPTAPFPKKKWMSIAMQQGNNNSVNAGQGAQSSRSSPEGMDYLLSSPEMAPPSGQVAKGHGKSRTQFVSVRDHCSGMAQAAAVSNHSNGDGNHDNSTGSHGNLDEPQVFADESEEHRSVGAEGGLPDAPLIFGGFKRERSDSEESGSQIRGKVPCSDNINSQKLKKPHKYFHGKNAFKTEKSAFTRYSTGNQGSSGRHGNHSGRDGNSDLNSQSHFSRGSDSQRVETEGGMASMLQNVNIVRPKAVKVQPDSTSSRGKSVQIQLDSSTHYSGKAMRMEPDSSSMHSRVGASLTSAFASTGRDIVETYEDAPPSSSEDNTVRALTSNNSVAQSTYMCQGQENGQVGNHGYGSLGFQEQRSQDASSTSAMYQLSNHLGQYPHRHGDRSNHSNRGSSHSNHANNQSNQGMHFHFVQPTLNPEPGTNSMHRSICCHGNNRNRSSHNSLHQTLTPGGACLFDRQSGRQNSIGLDLSMPSSRGQDSLGHMQVPQEEPVTITSDDSDIEVVDIIVKR